MEQDELSPRRYLKEGRYPIEGSVVADIGAAEGIFALEVIDYAKEVYLFEGDKEWLEALKRTFSFDTDHKIHIIPYYVGTGEGNTVKIDNYIDKKINYIKADIEGHEKEMLLGGHESFLAGY